MASVTFHDGPSRGLSETGHHAHDEDDGEATADCHDGGEDEEPGEATADCHDGGGCGWSPGL